MNDMITIAERINLLAKKRPIGRLQGIRKEIHHLSKPATRKIFSTKSIQNEFAFHSGGRTELQFNIGCENIDGDDRFRHGVAFSLETSRTLPNIEPLIPKIKKFNEFVRTYPDELAGFRMWHYASGKRSSDYPVGEIPHELVRPNTFIFIGCLSEKCWDAAFEPDYNLILNDFDVLLALYRFVEGDEQFPTLTQETAFKFSPGCTIKRSSTIANYAAKTLDVKLRHNLIQYELHNYLSEKFGPDTVGTENCGVAGTRLDLVYKTNNEFHIYEIKTALSARACVREALAQLLEYSYWPGAHEATKLIVVGEPKVDENCREFLSTLRHRFSLPISYAQFDMENKILIE